MGTLTPLGKPVEGVVQAGNDQDPEQSVDKYTADGEGADRAVAERPAAAF